MSYVNLALQLIFVANLVAAVITVFKEKREIAATWAWLLVLVLLPIIGFILYLFVGKKLPRNQIYDIRTQQQMGIDQLVKLQKEQWNEKELLPADEMSDTAREMVHLFLETDSAILTKHNHVEIIIDGQEKFRRLFADVKNAKDHIHVEYYTFYNDKIGNEFLHLLEEKARQGVKVRVIYDSFGSRGTTKRFFERLEKLGGEAESFFGGHHSFSNFRLNYRDHRKLVIIDGQIGYIGGFNVGDQYLGRSPKFGYWRDTHLRVVGNVAEAMQSRFFMDWNATVPQRRVDYQENYFPLIHRQGNTSIQIVSSGPDNEVQKIKLGYIKMINNATEYVLIQTPYLIPDDSLLEALSLAAFSGVKVKIMIPAKPDHAFVYRATQYYAKALLENNVEIYRYNNGFLHSKTLVVDGKIASVGSANMDYRSFKLNFEVNAFLYDQELSTQLRTIFENDMLHSTKLTIADFNAQSYWLKFKQYFSRLLSPIL
ncbi:cardiolipin synthase [Liquorilactobacillus satsumensis]|uniref:cardiolipin synthase n=1 Tax=Liquorilactobacillus satsumensis TaxID=259059 RepID=UPI0007052D8C|nr:cardiolipin synthase [Liquorilactobacillus satsumensis]MCC7667511.1 cardiolipin synthase [Liquorilactobacillus satsumensis]MCP9312338.1 cardiolipin synthase [Liquorilactobacillus satsumensis]MCP9327687.1 cardiolipin synthase [Liquorilactobacillus satsumensis]MCP9357042.1 cardiolipin synthase [Liquorilactobacillus satsumensis]MCP9359658.1 cardiolipin synthase [Liquorilactobacillus satsumensis]